MGVGKTHQPGQLSLPGIETATPATDRLFFALFPSADAAAQIGELAQHMRAEYQLKGKPLATARFHVTLHFLGDHASLPGSLVQSATEAANRVRMPPFRVSFDRAGSFSGRPKKRPLVLRGTEGVEELDELMTFQQTLGDSLKHVGLARHIDTRFTPHATLLYADRLLPLQRVAPISWTATEFVLVHSLIGRTKHVPLGRWPLTS